MSSNGPSTERAMSLGQFLRKKIAKLKLTFDDQAKLERKQKLTAESNDLLESNRRTFSVNDLSERLDSLSFEEQTPKSPIIKPLKNYDEAIFLFADMTSFSLRAKTMHSKDLTRLLDEIYHAFNNIVKEHGWPYGIEVVKLTGDSIMLSACHKKAAQSLKDQAVAMVNVGWHLLQFLNKFNQQRVEPIHFRFGINIGPATEASISLTGPNSKSIQNTDWFGEGVNFASRMESSSLPNQIQLSERMYRLVADQFNCSRCVHQVKSYGSMETYFVLHPLKKSKHKAHLVQFNTHNAASREASDSEVYLRRNGISGMNSAPALRLAHKK